MYKFYQIIAVVVTLFCSSAYASDSMKQFQYNLEKTTHNSKASSTVAIVRGGSVFQTSSKSVADNTQFYIGSVSKHITAYMLLASLHEQYPGVPLSELLNQKIDSLFLGSPILKSIGKDWTSKVTLLDLLTRRSGLSDYLDSYGDGHSISEALNQPISASELLLSISFNPEKKHLYSNSNYLLIGKLIEEINGDNLANVFERVVKVPAGMDLSFCPVSLNYFSLKDSACCKNLAPNLNDTVFIDMTNAIGGGNIISTRGDLIKWGRYLFKSAPEEIRSAMLKNYGMDPDGDIINLGLDTSETTHLGDLIGHQGGIDSFSSFFGYAPKSDTLIIILSNSNDDANLLMENLISWISEPEEDLLSLNMHQEQLTWSWTKKMIEEKAAAEFAKEYHDAHPNAEENGYGPFALVPYNDMQSDLTGESLEVHGITPDLL